MSILDETIRISGRTVTLIRIAGDVTTYMRDSQTVLAGKRRIDPLSDFEVGAMFPSDSGIVSGDLVYDTVTNYLAMSVLPRKVWDELLCYDVMLYKCNSLVSIYSYSAVYQKTNLLVKADVPCLITQVRAPEWNEDKVAMAKTYKGKLQPFQVFMQDGNGLTNTSYIKDAAGRHYRISKDFDIFIAEGVIQCQALWET
jgi:hypothetical protein